MLTAQLIKLFNQITKYVELQLNEFMRITENKHQNLVRCIIEMPKGVQYKLEYDRGAYWVKRPLEGFKNMPADYGYTEHTLGPNFKEIDAIIYIPSSVPSNFITTPGIGHECIPLLGLWGETSTSPEFKLIVIPAMHVDLLNSPVEFTQLTQTIISIMFSLNSNYNLAVTEKTRRVDVFSILELTSYTKTIALLHKYKQANEKI